jgi:hypothetical protein
MSPKVPTKVGMITRKNMVFVYGLVALLIGSMAVGYQYWQNTSGAFSLSRSTESTCTFSGYGEGRSATTNREESDQGYRNSFEFQVRADGIESGISEDIEYTSEGEVRLQTRNWAGDKSTFTSKTSDWRNESGGTITLTCSGSRVQVIAKGTLSEGEKTQENVTYKFVFSRPTKTRTLELERAERRETTGAYTNQLPPKFVLTSSRSSLDVKGRNDRQLTEDCLAPYYFNYDAKERNASGYGIYNGGTVSFGLVVKDACRETHKLTSEINLGYTILNSAGVTIYTSTKEDIQIQDKGMAKLTWRPEGTSYPSGTHTIVFANGVGSRVETVLDKLGIELTK